VHARIANATLNHIVDAIATRGALVGLNILVVVMETAKVAKTVNSSLKGSSIK
jgi:hypothetical protein